MEKRLANIEKHVEVLNRELGEIVGELKWIRYIIIGTFLAAAIDLIRGFLSG